MTEFLSTWLRRTAAFGIAWALMVLLVGPWLVTRAYEGQSWEIFNALLRGRDAHPLDFYLDAWSSMARGATIVFALAWFGVVAAARFPELTKRGTGYVLSGTPSLAPGAFLSLVATLGFLGGLAEATYHALRQIVIHAPDADFYPELLITAPLSAAVAALAVGTPLAVVGRLAGSRFGLWKSAVVFGLPGLYGVLQSDGIPLHPGAAWLLGAGLAVGLARLLVRHGARLEPFWPRIAGGLTLVLAVAIVGAVGWHSPAREQARLSSRPAPREGLPNILLIILDTVRAANMSLYGYPRPTTPRLSDWSGSGVTFRRAISVAPWTLPSHASMFTGLYNIDLGVGSRQPLGKQWETLAEWLSAHGYATGAFVANPHYTSRMSGLQQGFVRYRELPINLPRTLVASEFSRMTLDALRSLLGIEGWRPKNGYDVRREFLSWLREPRGGRPYFAFLNFFDAHAPYSPPMPDDELFGSKPDESWYAFLDRWRSDPDSVYTPESVRQWMDMYDSGIAFIDRQLGVIHDAIEDMGELDNTLVIITADHGEMWGERGLIEHANTVYEPVLHVPLVLSYPGRVPSGATVTDAVSLRDLAATILDLAGVPGLGDGHGESFSWSWSGASGGGGSMLFSQFDPEPADQRPGRYARGALRSLFSGHLHYVFDVEAGRDELYDLSVDPLESVDLASRPGRAEDLRRLRSELRAFLEEAGESGDVLASLPP